MTGWTKLEYSATLGEVGTAPFTLGGKVCHRITGQPNQFERIPLLWVPLQHGFNEYYRHLESETTTPVSNTVNNAQNNVDNYLK